MKHSIENKSDVEKVINVEIPKEKINKEIESTFETLKKNAQIKGFRKGKVPRNVLEMHYKEQVHSDVMSKLINDSYSKALDDEKLEPVSYPQFDADKFEPDKDYTYKATVQVKPGINPENYEGLELTREKVEITEKDVENVINHLRDSHAVLKIKDIETPGEGDFAVTEVEAYVDGKLLTPENQKTQNMHIGSGLVNPDIEKALKEMKKGDQRTVKSKIDKDFEDKKYAGKDTEFKIKLKEIRERVLPDIDDNFARSMGPYKDLKDLKDQAKEQIKTQRENTSRVKLQNQAFKKLIEINTFEVPSVMVENEKNYMINEFKARMSRRRMPEEEQKKQIEKSGKEFDEEALDRVKKYLLLEAIAKKEKIRADSQEIESKMQSTAKGLNVPINQIKEYYSKGNALAELKGQIVSEKTLDFVIRNANIKLEPAKTHKESGDKKDGADSNSG